MPQRRWTGSRARAAVSARGRNGGQRAKKAFCLRAWSEAIEGLIVWKLLRPAGLVDEIVRVEIDADSPPKGGGQQKSQSLPIVRQRLLCPSLEDGELVSFPSESAQRKHSGKDRRSFRC